MPAKHTLHVALTEPLVRYVHGKVQDGAYASASEVIRLALEAMIRSEKAAGRAASAMSQDMKLRNRG
jgi:putative addiction module CopG family antidote